LKYSINEKKNISLEKLQEQRNNEIPAPLKRL